LKSNEYADIQIICLTEGGEVKGYINSYKYSLCSSDPWLTAENPELDSPQGKMFLPSSLKL
jgi:hypothetical protein